MADRQRYPSQYDRDRPRRDYRDDYPRVQPREWYPDDDARRDRYRGREQQDPRDRYASYYNDRQFSTRGRDEREQGSSYGAEEQWRPWPNDSGYARRGWGHDDRPRRAQYGEYERGPSSYAARSFDDTALRRVQSEPSYRNNYDHDYDDYEEHESFGHQLREAGQKLARTVKRAFRGPKGYKRSDERIREDVSDRLGEHPYLDCSEVEVNVSNGEITLTGVVNSRHEKFLLEEIADEVSGVTEVHNQVRVKRAQQSNLAMAETAPGTQMSAEIAARSRGRA